MEEGELGLRVDDNQPVGLGDLRGDLGEVFCAGDADGDGKGQFVAHAPADRRGDLGRRAEEVRAACDVGESLVDRDPLDQRREVAQYPDRGVAEPLVLLEVPADEDQVGAKLSRPPTRHAAVDTEGLRFVGRREHHAAPDCDRLPLEGRVEHLLDGGVERVQVRVKDRGRIMAWPVPPCVLLPSDRHRRIDPRRAKRRQPARRDPHHHHHQCHGRPA